MQAEAAARTAAACTLQRVYRGHRGRRRAALNRYAYASKLSLTNFTDHFDKRLNFASVSDSVRMKAVLSMNRCYAIGRFNRLIWRYYDLACRL
jgi:hypothetical protein